MVHRTATGSRVPIGPKSLAEKGDFIEIYCDGLGELRWPNPKTDVIAEATVFLPRVPFPAIRLDGNALGPDSIDYAGIAPSYPASYQINVLLPTKLSAGRHKLRIQVGKSAISTGLFIGP